MTTISKNALVPYSAGDMFRLVDDIEAYSEFLPWCSGSTVLHRDDDEVRATIDITKGAVRKSFTTLNRLQHNKMIEIRLLQGPFRHLEGYWRFQALEEDACKVSLDLDFEFSSRMMGMVVGPVFHQIASSLVDAFTERAQQVYGRR